MWLFLNGFLVFFMQCGFGMLEAGAVSRKNVRNILVKNVMDACLGALTFWLVGYGVAYGGNGSFMGDEHFFGGECLDDYFNPSKTCGHSYIDWFFQFAFAATAATIVSGAVAERTHFACYFIYSIVLTGLVYPTVVHWVWGGGFLAEEGVHDFAGSGVVHMVGGLAGLVGAAVIGPRADRFSGDRFDVTVNRTSPYSITFMGLGVFILWTGWYGFNVGSTLDLSGSEETAALVAINTTIAPATSGIVCMMLPFFYSWARTGLDTAHMSPEGLLNGVLAGLVSITAGCDIMTPGLACVTGLIGGLIFLASSHLLQQLKIDDPLDAAPIHFFCGAWGVLAVGLFAKQRYTDLAGMQNHGIFYGDEGHLLGWQMIEILAISGWTGGWALLVFVPLKMVGYARVSEEVERVGLDIHKHGGFPMELVVKPALKPSHSGTKVSEDSANSASGDAP